MRLKIDIFSAAIGLALIHFIRTDLINEVADDIAQVQGVQHADAEIDRELQAGFAGPDVDGAWRDIWLVFLFLADFRDAIRWKNPHCFCSRYQAERGWKS